jgi:hypothetical protein
MYTYVIIFSLSFEDSSKDSTSTLVVDFRKIKNKKVKIKILSTLTKCVLIVASIAC